MNGGGFSRYLPLSSFRYDRYMNTENPFKTQSSKVVYENPWIRIHEDAIVRPDGSEGIYGYLESKDSVQIVAVNESQEIYLVKAFRYPSKTWGWELPGGGGEGEDIVVASQRELAEETGLTASKWTPLGSPLVCNGLMTERQAVLLAEDLTFGERIDSDDKYLVTDGKFASLDEIDRMIDAGEIDDGMTMTALFLAGRHFAKQ